MHKINKYNKTTVTSVSSDEILYQGKGNKCISEDCTNASITGVIDSIGDISCWSYNQLNSLSNVDLGCLSNQVGCDDKTLLSLFNVIFERFCLIQNSITGLETATPGKIILDFCTAINYSCADPCLFPVPCCSADEGQFLNDIIQAIIGRTIRHSNQICTINNTLISLQTQIDNLTTGIGSPYTPPTVQLTCSSYWDGTAYIPTPLVTFSLDEAIEFLDADLCQVKRTVGRYDNFTTNKNTQYIDPITGDITYDYTESLNLVAYGKQMADYLFNLKLQVNAMQIKLDECCRTDCDQCMDNYFTNVSTNYGAVANGSASTPYIDLYHVINTQALPSCLGNAIVLSRSNYYISDGVTTKVIPLDALEGITVQSGTIETQAFLRFDLAELNMDYLRDITIKLKVATALDCTDNFRELVQRFDNPTCDQCMFCIKKLSEADTGSYTISFDLNFSGGVYANETRNYVLNTSNPCISIDKKVGQVVTLSNVTNLTPSKAILYSTCGEFGLPEPCSVPGEVITDTTCWFFETPLSEMLDAKARAWNIDGSTGPLGATVDVTFNFALYKDDPNFGYTFNKLFSTTNLTGETLTGDVYTLQDYTDNNSVEQWSLTILPNTPVVGTGADTNVKSKSACGTATAAWDPIPDMGGAGFPGDILQENMDGNNSDTFTGSKFLSVKYTKNGSKFGFILEITGQTSQVPPLVEIRSKATNSPLFLRGEALGNCNC